MKIVIGFSVGGAGRGATFMERARDFECKERARLEGTEYPSHDFGSNREIKEGGARLHVATSKRQVTNS